AQELGLQLLPGSDVGIDHQLGLGVALIITQEDPTGFDDDLPAVPGELAQLTAPPSLFEHGAGSLGQVGTGGPEKEFIDVLAEDLTCRPAIQFFSAAVPEAYPVVQVADQDGIGYLIQQGSLFPEAFSPLTCEPAVECHRPQNKDSREAVHYPVPEGNAGGREKETEQHKHRTGCGGGVGVPLPPQPQRGEHQSQGQRWVPQSP